MFEMAAVTVPLGPPAQVQRQAQGQCRVAFDFFMSQRSRAASLAWSPAFFVALAKELHESPNCARIPSGLIADPRGNPNAAGLN
jgi:hypothetical protein